MFLTVCYYHATYAFQSQSTLYNCLNFKELLAQSRHEIRSLSECNWTRTHNHLVRKRTLNHFGQLQSIKILLFTVDIFLVTLFIINKNTKKRKHNKYPWFPNLKSWITDYSWQNCAVGRLYLDPLPQNDYSSTPVT